MVLKAENLQRTGSFKIRGAMNKLATLGSEAERGVTTGSAGNHAQALAFVAQHFDVPCRIFVPVGAPITKIEASRRYGAVVTETGADLKAAVAAAEEHAATTGMIFCAPFDDPAVVAGQGTLGLELLDDIHDLVSVIVPLGGGGLIKRRGDRREVGTTGRPSDRGAGCGVRAGTQAMRSPRGLW